MTNTQQASRVRGTAAEQRPERHEEDGYPVIAMWITVLLLIGILVAALTAVA